MFSIVDDHEVTNPFAVTEAYVRAGEAWSLASLSFTRLTSALWRWTDLGDGVRGTHRSCLVGE